MMVVVGVDVVIDAAVVVVEAKGAVMVVVVSEPNSNLDEEKSTVSHDNFGLRNYHVRLLIFFCLTSSSVHSPPPPRLLL